MDVSQKIFFFFPSTQNHISVQPESKFLHSVGLMSIKNIIIQGSAPLFF